jgi:hypothetical protein
MQLKAMLCSEYSGQTDEYSLLFKRFREWDLQTVNFLSETCVMFEGDVVINIVFKTGFIKLN